MNSIGWTIATGSFGVMSSCYGKIAYDAWAEKDNAKCITHVALSALALSATIMCAYYGANES